MKDMLDDWVAKGFLNDVIGDMTNKDFDLDRGEKFKGAKRFHDEIR